MRSIKIKILMKLSGIVHLINYCSKIKADFIYTAQMAYYNLKYIQRITIATVRRMSRFASVLGRLGIRFANDDFIKLKEYVKLHERLLMNLIGVGIISRHLLAWTEGEVVLS